VIFINVQHAKHMYHFTLCAFVGLNYSNLIVMHRMENLKNLKRVKRETIRHFRNRRREYLNDKINEQTEQEY